MQPVSVHGRKYEFNMFSDNCPNRQRFRNVSCPEYYLFHGYSVEESINLIRDRQSKIAQKSNPPEHLSKLSQINSGDYNPASMKKLMERTGKETSELKSILSQRTSGVKNGFYGKKHSKETMIKLAMTRSKQAKQISKPELIVWGMLSALGIQFDFQVPIDRYVVDFLVGDTAIEVYGDYWHGEKMKSSNRKRDTEKENFIKSAYNLIVLSESQISSDPQEVVNILCGLRK
jgi:very-short-patch-repair endonuclease